MTLKVYLAEHFHNTKTASEKWCTYTYEKCSRLPGTYVMTKYRITFYSKYYNNLYNEWVYGKHFAVYDVCIIVTIIIIRKPDIYTQIMPPLQVPTLSPCNIILLDLYTK